MTRLPPPSPLPAIFTWNWIEVCWIVSNHLAVDQLHKMVYPLSSSPGSMGCCVCAGRVILSSFKPQTSSYYQCHMNSKRSEAPTPTPPLIWLLEQDTLFFSSSGPLAHSPVSTPAVQPVASERQASPSQPRAAQLPLRAVCQPGPQQPTSAVGTTLTVKTFRGESFVSKRWGRKDVLPGAPL